MGLALGCVPKGRHEIVEVQLQATRTALSSRTAQGIVDSAEADARQAALQEEIARRQLQLDELLARAALTDAELGSLQAERAGLLDRIAGLEAELAEVRTRGAPKKKGGAPVAPPAPVETVATLARAEVLEQLEQHHASEIERQRLEAAQVATMAAFAGLVGEGRVEVEPRGTAAVVRIPTALLFQEGFTTLSPRGVEIVGQAVEALKTVPGRRVMVEGHTDDVPVHSAEFASNWERAFSRAMAVLRGLEGAGAALSASSFAGTRPLGPNDTEEGRERNQRVELVIEVDPGVLTAFEATPPPEPEPADGEGTEPVVPEPEGEEPQP